MRFHFGWKSHFVVQSLFSTCVHMNWGEMKLKTVWISYRSFWQKWHFISGDKILCKHRPKWNAYTCPSKYGSLWNAAKIKYHVNRTCVQASSGMSSFRLSCGRTVRRIFMRRLFTGTARQLFSLKIPSQTFHWVWIPLCR